MRHLLLVSALFLCTSQAWAVDLNGRWEVQAMGADREVDIRHKGGKILAHRTMWPEFEGERYKLEHLYRGTISGNVIKGELLVKEPELKDFEVLREFTGTVNPMGEMTLDGLPLKRLAAGASTAPETPTPATPTRASEPPALSQASPPASVTPPSSALASATPPPSATATPPSAPKEAEADPGTSLFASIMGSPGGGELFRVSSAVTIPSPTASLMGEGDELFAGGKARPALAKYQEAAKLEGASLPALLYRVGKCQLALRQYAAARDTLKRALKLDPGNRMLGDDYAKAKALAG